MKEKETEMPSLYICNIEIGTEVTVTPLNGKAPFKAKIRTIFRTWMHLEGVEGKFGIYDGWHNNGIYKSKYKIQRQ